MSLSWYQPMIEKFRMFRTLINVRFPNGSESGVETAWGPGLDPRPASYRPGKFPSGRKGEAMINLLITVSIGSPSAKLYTQLAAA
jgi:hypothetical protein